MRALASILLVSTLVLGWNALAGGDEAAAPTAKRLEALELQVEYLRSREAALSAYVMRNGERAASLTRLVDTVRRQGFTKRAIPAESRESLLNGLSALARDLGKDLPAVSEADQVTLKKIAAATKK